MGPRAFTRRIGRNESFNHAGNAVAAAIAGVGAWKDGPIVVFYLIADMALLSIVSVLTIRADAIDYDRARGLQDGPSASRDKTSGLSVLLSRRGLMIFCLCCVIFHLANAAMLPLVGQKLALQDENQGTALMSGCIVAAQIVMVPMAMLVGHKAEIWAESLCFLPDSLFCLCAVFSTPFRMIAFGCSRSKVSMASAPGFMARCFRSSLRIDSRYRPFQFGPRRCDNRARHRRVAQHVFGRPSSFMRLFCRISRFGGNRGFRISAVFFAMSETRDFDRVQRDHE